MKKIAINGNQKTIYGRIKSVKMTNVTRRIKNRKSAGILLNWRGMVSSFSGAVVKKENPDTVDCRNSRSISYSYQ